MTNGADDLLWKAQVWDETATFFERFDRNLDRIANASEAQFSRVDQSARSSGREIGLIAGVVAGLTTKLVEMGLQAVGALKGFLKQSTMLKARVDTLAVSLAVVGRNAGYTTEQLAQYEEDVKGMGITTQASRQSLLQMAQAELDLGRAADIARLSQDAAVIAGINSSEAFQRVVYAIQTLNPRMLRMIGLTVNLQAEYKKMEAQTGTLAKNLTYQQKQQITLNAVIKAGEGIVGTYEAAMGSAGKQLTSLPRYIEEVQLALGAAFQPALSAQVGFMTDKLKELLEWLQENQDQIEKFAESLGAIVRELFEFLDGVVGFVSKIPGYVEEAGAILAKAVGKALDVASPEEIEKRRSKLGEYFGMAVTMLAAYIATAVKGITEFFAIAFEQIGVWLKRLGLIEGDAAAALDHLNDRIENFAKTIVDAHDAAFISVGQFMGVLEEEKEVVEDASDSVEEFDDSLAKLTEALKVVRGELDKLKGKMEMEAAKRAVEDVRKAEEAALRLSHSLEDIERRRIERIDKIYKQAQAAYKTAQEQLGKDELKLAEKQAQQRYDLEKDKSDSIIDIERNFRRTLQDIADEFAYQAEDAARRNDAIALLRLMRDKKRQIAEAGKAKSREREDAKTDYAKKSRDLNESIAKDREVLRRDFQERLQALDENLMRQLQQAEEQREKDLENLARTLDRRKQIEDLHRKHAAEDRKKALDKELMDLVAHFASMEGLTQRGLDATLLAYKRHFGDLTAVSEAYAKQAAPTTILPSYIDPGRRPQQRPGRIYGQAGQVSQMLAPQGRVPSMWTAPMISAVPSVAARRSVERREIHLSGDVSGLDPYFQRVMVAGLLEIERNRG